MGHMEAVGTTEVVVHGRHVDLSSRFREHVADKLEKVGKFGVPIARVDVEVSKETNPRLADRAYEVELTCRSRGPVIRAEAYSTDHYSAFDIAYGRLTERLRRYADKHRPHRGGRHAHKGSLANEPWADAEVLTEAPAAPETPEEPVAEDAWADAEAIFEQGPVVVREKVHATAPMTVEAAVTQMELVGHNFYLFQDVDTGAHSVVYRRRGYDYGLIRIVNEDAPAG